MLEFSRCTNGERLKTKEAGLSLGAEVPGDLGRTASVPSVKLSNAPPLNEPITVRDVATRFHGNRRVRGRRARLVDVEKKAAIKAEK